MSVRYVIMYKLKNKKNIEDIVNICLKNSIEPILILREDVENIEIESLKTFRNIEEAINYISSECRNITYIVLETYGNEYTFDVEYRGNLCIIVGAEDIGVPEDEVTKIVGNKHIVKIPMKIQGTSYNVVSSFVMLLTEILRQNIMMRVS